MLALVASLLLAAEIPWHHPLALDNGGVWRQRVAVTVENSRDQPLVGQPVTLPIGTAPAGLAITGAEAAALRVCSESGEERLFALADRDGRRQDSGPIAAGSTLTIPVDAPARGKATYLVYLLNPRAGVVPDMLPNRAGLANGGLEDGRGDTPAFWTHDEPDESHRASWSDDRPHGGKRCLKTVVAKGAEPTWIATRQRDVPIVGGARYRMTAHVRADAVDGQAGWYIHLGNAKNPMLASPMLAAGSGTFDWKPVTADFTAPPEADTADLGTVLRGTGTAWFDDVTLECLDAPQLRITCGPLEPLNLTVVGQAPSANAGWAAHPGTHRAVVSVIHTGPEPTGPALGSIDLTRLEGPFHGRLDRATLAVLQDFKPRAAFVSGDRLLFAAEAPPHSASAYLVTFTVRDTLAPAVPATPPPALQNLVKDGGFESGGNAWTRTDGGRAEPGVTLSLDDPARADLGRHCARMQVAPTAPEGWRGWRQEVPVRPGRTYLVSAWLRCKDLTGGEARVHLHRARSDGQLCAEEPMTSVGPGVSGTADWTLVSGLTTMPADAARLQVHLTMNGSGTLWHDAVVVAEVLPATVREIESRPRPEAPPVTAWPVPAVVKVFPEETAPAPDTSARAARLFAARNEREPLQVAVRSQKALNNVRIVADPPTGPSGARGVAAAVNVVGYVPIDHPTSYYQSRTPSYVRKTPKEPGQCDGWAGDWPDPLLPTDRLALPAGATRSFWVTLTIPESAPPGDYQGTVRLLGPDAATLSTVPYTLHVWNHALPATSHLRAIYDIGGGPGGREQWELDHASLYREVAPLMARSRLCPNRFFPDPVFRYDAGRATADFTAFDAAAHVYFDDWKLPHAYMPQLFYLFGWGFPPKDLFGEHPYDGAPPFTSADRSQLRPAYRQAYQACLRLFWDHVKAKGWADRFVLYISDEPFYTEAPIVAQMKALCAMIHEVDPKIPIYSSTWHHVPAWDGSLDIWGIGHYGVVAPEVMAQIKARGAKIWFTTDGQMCTDTPACAVERLLPYYAFKYGAEAYEFWGVAWLTYDPYRYGWHAYIHQSDAPGKEYWVRYPNGDGFLLYPGAPFGRTEPVSSIRFEQAREGVEDYEALILLRDRIAADRQRGRDVRAAEQALAAAEALVTIPNAGGRYASKILPDPARLYDARQNVGQALESLAP